MPRTAEGVKHREVSVAELRYHLGLDKPEDRLGWHVVHLNDVIDVPDFGSGMMSYRETGDVAYIFVGDRKLLNATVKIDEEKGEATYTFTVPYGPLEVKP